MPAAPNMEDPVTYTIIVQHWMDGTIHVKVEGIGHSEQDRLAARDALIEASELCLEGIVVSRDN